MSRSALNTAGSSDALSTSVGAAAKALDVTLPLTSAEFSRGGRRILVASQDGTVRTYVCQICGGLSDLRRLAHALLRGVR